MPLLSSADLDDIWTEVMRRFSNINKPIPVTKNKLRSGLTNIDSELNTAEATILAGIGDAEVKSWLQTNQDIGREIIVMVEQKRQEKL